MRAFISVLLTCVAGQLAQAQEELTVSLPPAGRIPTDFIPKGYKQMPNGLATGDLNHDGRTDIALVVSRQVEDQNEQRSKHLLLLLFATPTGYTLAASSNRAVLEKGGMDQETFRKVTIQNGTLRLEHASASNWFWRVSSLFRYQAGAFYLIGETTESGRTGGTCEGLRGPAGWQYHDTNFLTGTHEVWRISEACHVLEHRRNHFKPAILKALASYRPPEL